MMNYKLEYHKKKPLKQTWANKAEINHSLRLQKKRDRMASLGIYNVPRWCENLFYECHPGINEYDGNRNVNLFCHPIASHLSQTLESDLSQLAYHLKKKIKKNRTREIASYFNLSLIPR